MAACHRTPRANPSSTSTTFDDRTVYGNFATDARDDRLLASQLEQLSALPNATTWPPARDLVVHAGNRRLTALTSNRLVQLDGEAPIDLPAREAESEEPNFQHLFEERAEPEQMLIFTSPGAELVSEAASCTVPEAIVLREAPTVRPELLLKATCFRGPSGHSIVFYEARRGDGRGAWQMIRFYDATFEPLGQAGRAPERWRSGIRARRDDFALFGIFTVKGLPSPIFVTTESCAGFVLHSFLPSGHFARVVVPFLSVSPTLGCTRH
jgi:hypothetical protein